MDCEEPEFNPPLVETDPAKTSESVQNSPVERIFPLDVRDVVRSQ
jgi:hypothetical protein